MRLSSRDVISILKEVYDVYFPNEKEQIEYNLIGTRLGTVSLRLFARYFALQVKGREQMKSLFKNMVHKSNTFGHKEIGFGAYLPIPLKYK